MPMPISTDCSPFELLSTLGNSAKSSEKAVEKEGSNECVVKEEKDDDICIIDPPKEVKEEPKEVKEEPQEEVVEQVK